MSNWGLRWSKAAKGVTTPLFYCWRINGVNLTAHGLPSTGWMWGLLPGVRGHAMNWKRLTEQPIEAPMNRQRARREMRQMAQDRMGQYKLPRDQRRKMAHELAKATQRKFQRG